MPAFLDNIFSNKGRSAQTAEGAIADCEVALESARGRIKLALQSLKDVADLSVEEHANLDAELTSARREEARQTARLDKLKQEQDRLEKEESIAEFVRQRAALQKRVDVDYSKHEAVYERGCRLAADAIGAMTDIDTATEEFNGSLAAAKKADPTASLPEAVVTSAQRYRTEEPCVTPERTIVEERWRVRERGKWRDVAVFGQDAEGNMVPRELGAERYQFTRVVPSKSKPGRVLPSPTIGLSLPPARPGREPFWPKRQ